MRVVRPWDVYSIGSLCWQSFVFGVSLQTPLVLLLAVALHSLGPDKWSIFMTVAAIMVGLFSFLIGPAIGLARYRVHLNTGRRRAAAILFVSGGLLCVIYVFVLIGVAFGAIFQLLAVMGLHAAIFAVWLLLSTVLWPAISRKFPFHIVDGESCARCGYCLRGVASRICPECGRAFTQYDLGLSFAEFERLIEDQRRTGT